MLRLCLGLGVLVALCAAQFTLELSDEAINLWVQRHNEERNRTANETGIPLDPLQWDPEIAKSAAFKSSMCIFSHAYGNEHPNGYGENIYLGAGWEDGITVANKSSNMWADEKYNVDNLLNSTWSCIPTEDPEVTCGHYTQMVWKQSKYFGCAVTQGCLVFGSVFSVTFCEYNPAGNLLVPTVPITAVGPF